MWQESQVAENADVSGVSPCLAIQKAAEPRS